MRAALTVGARPWWLALGMAAALVACGDDQQELQQWMDQQRREVKPNVPPLQAPKPFLPQSYSAADRPDPFSTLKIAGIQRQDPAKVGKQLDDPRRRAEPLESFPLDAMAMVGSFVKAGQQYALVRVDKLLYQVKVGDFMGENKGRITKITETEVSLQEIVLNAVGDQEYRPNSLQLQERAR
jgi:type IV pilus assembly protein PilP